MIHFNDILRLEGIDPESVRLVRHQDARAKETSLYEIWRSRRKDFELYQSIQKKGAFGDANYVASFIVPPLRPKESLFVGLFAITGGVVAPERTEDPVSRTDASGKYIYELKHDRRLVEYEQKLRVEWGTGTRQWLQRAERQDKLVLAIREEVEVPFPGFENLCISLEDVDNMPYEWKLQLKQNKGVYLLVEKESGKMYVGSATGEDSLLQRWSDYARDGHGGNVELKKLKNPSYRMSVLHAVPMQYPDQDIRASESMWKKKLMSRTREHGLNGN
jgi:GIY-YIG catalytic domain